MQKTLSDLSLGEKATIVSLNAPPLIKARLMDMGFIKGVQIQLIQYAPLGNPLLVTLRGYKLCIRKEDAHLIIVSPIL